VLPQEKYASIITILHNLEDLSNMTLAIVIGKIVAFEMSRKMGQEEASSSSKGKALTCNEKKNMKGKQVETSSTSNLDEELIKLINKVKKMILRLNIKGVPIQIQDCIFTNQRREQRKRGCYRCDELGHFVEVCPNKTTPKTKKKACKDKALTSVRSWDDSSSEEDHHKRRGRKHSSSSSSRVCLMAQGNESSSSGESDSDDEMPSLSELVQENLKYAKVCTSQQKKLTLLKEKLDSSQQAYATLLEQYEAFANLNVELSTKIEQLEASANTNNCTINDKQLVKKNEKLKEKLASTQDAYKSLLTKMKTMCKHCDELTNKVASLETVGTTPPRYLKRKVQFLICLKGMPLLLQ
jgi:hypothetical protein